MKKRVNIKDVAKEADVSAATISYVLNQNQHESISAETKDRIWEAVKKLNYVPNLNARSLISRRSNLLGVLIPQTEPGKEFMFSNPFYGEFLSSVEFTARQRGYHLLISGMNADQGYVSIARNRGLDGIIILGTFPSQHINELKDLEIPVVLVDSYIKDYAFHDIGINDRYGGYIATKHLIEKGHREIALVSGTIQKDGVSEKRFLGYRDALDEADIAYDKKMLYEGNVGYQYGLEAAALLVKRGNLQTAAFVTADIMALGFIKGLKINKLSVPGDISVIGFDDIYLAQLCDPALTTVKQDIHEKGRAAVQIIIDDAESSKHSKRDIIIPIEICERDSVSERIGENNK